ncbi:MAG: hypothetical protein ACOC7U_04105 [Spirochaetota bacterium]
MSDALSRKAGSSAGWGAVVLFGAPVAAGAACATLVGIPLGIIILLLYGIALYISHIPVSFFIGKLIFGRFRSVENKGIMFVSFLIGLVILRLIRFIPVIGWVAAFAVVLFGLGAMVVAERTRRALLK